MLPVTVVGGERGLLRFFDDLHTLSAKFEQRVIDAGGELVQRIKGRMVLQRPGFKFRWDYRKPYHQLIVADGKYLWVYDEDLEQVTRSTLDRSLGATPAMLLGSERPMTDDFIVSEQAVADGMAWLLLLPRDQQATFKHIRLGFERSVLRRMELLDGFGNTTILDFSDVERNRAVSPGLFEFIPPPGVDVVGGDGRHQ